MTETNKMLEECANYLLNHCFVLGGVEDQRAKYLYVQDHLNEVEFFDNLQLTEKEEQIDHQVIKEIRSRLEFLRNVGLEYLSRR